MNLIFLYSDTYYKHSARFHPLLAKGDFLLANVKHELNSAEYKFYLVDFGYFSYRVSNISTLLQAFLKRKV